MNFRPALIVLLLGALGAEPALAGEDNSTTQVSLQVAASCRISSTQNINFGDYDPVGVHAELASYAAGSVSLVCTRGTSNVKVALQQGSHAGVGSSCNAPQRNMSGPEGAKLGYAIYQDAAHQVPWGCGEETAAVLPAFDGSLQPVSVATYGVMPAGQDARQGEYRDTVEVVVSF